MLILSPKLWRPGKGGDHCTRRRAEMVAMSAACAWPHTALLPPGSRELMKGVPGPKPRLAAFLSVHHCRPSWLQASCLTSHVCSPSRVFHFCSALSFGVPVLVFPGYLFISWLSHTYFFALVYLDWPGSDWPWSWLLPSTHVLSVFHSHKSMYTLSLALAQEEWVPGHGLSHITSESPTPNKETAEMSGK